MIRPKKVIKHEIVDDKNEAEKNENDVIWNGILIIPICYENWKQAERNK